MWWGLNACLFVIGKVPFLHFIESENLEGSLNGSDILIFSTFGSGPEMMGMCFVVNKRPVGQTHCIFRYREIPF